MIRDEVKPVNILEQMTNCVCRIGIFIGNDMGYATGFFCKVIAMKFLMTCNHVINEEYIKKNKGINLSINDDKEPIRIDLGIQREIYCNEEYDTTFIELKEEDKIKNYLEIDDNMFKDDLSYYDYKSIYILHYSKAEEVYVSYGILKNPDIKKNKFMHSCFSEEGSSGSPILNLKNNKVIGIHIKHQRYQNNIGTFLKYPLNLNDFRNKRYKIIKELGKGGFGKVNQILSILDNEYYAMKEIQLQGETEDKINNIKKEAIILSQFNNNNIVKYYDSFQDEEKFYILMEYCDGKNLKNFLDEYKKNNTLIEENIIYNIIKQICSGLKEIHEMKIVHRDLKPDNFFMNEKTEIKIGDFGISKQLSSYTTQISNTKAGSFYYTAPELMANGLFNTKSDMWSLGCIIYELLTLNIYFLDKFQNEIKRIDANIYNYKWQELIDSLLQTDYNKRADIKKVCNFLEKEINININNNKDNKIVGEVYINKDDINDDIQIINSFENVKRKYKRKNKDDDYKYENEKEIKENIEIKINEKKIEFNYNFKFNKEGNYIIEYLFKKNLTKTDYMFHGCRKLTNLNLSNFNTNNVVNMQYMFANCNSLKNLNFSNCNIQKATNTEGMFNNCISLKKKNIITKDNKILKAFEK